MAVRVFNISAAGVNGAMGNDDGLRHLIPLIEDDGGKEIKVPVIKLTNGGKLARVVA